MSHFKCICLTVCILVSIIEGDKTYERGDYNLQRPQYPRKRPFCNAFTGCGRKRSFDSTSQISASSPTLNTADISTRPEKISKEDANINYEDDSIGDLLDLNSEPAVEDLMRQIMSQAKLWEAIQEANQEMILQKARHNQHIKFPIQFNAQ